MIVVVLAGLTLLLLAVSTDPAGQYAELVAVGQRMLWVFVPYSGLVLGALVLYRFSDHDLRAFATVAILGPFTLLRPWVIASGATVGMYASADRATWVLTIIACASVVILGRLLDRRARLGRTCQRP